MHSCGQHGTATAWLMTEWPGTAIRVPEALAVLEVGYRFQPARTVDIARETALRKLRLYDFFFFLCSP